MDFTKKIFDQYKHLEGVPISEDQIVDILECMMELSKEDPDAAMSVLDSLYKSGYPSTVKGIFRAVRWYVDERIWRRAEEEGRKTYESELAKLFRERHKDLIPGSEIVTFKAIPGHFPDAMIKIDGICRPVEIKREAFVSASVRQLQRYIEVYESDIGYAVAPALNVSLPPNMRFIELKFD